MDAGWISPSHRLSSPGRYVVGEDVVLDFDNDGVDNVIALIRSECEARKEFLPAQALPFPESILPSEPVEVRTGGAIMFMDSVDRFEKT